MSSSVEEFLTFLEHAERSPLTIINYRCDLRGSEGQPGTCCIWASPIVIDMDGDAFNFTNEATGIDFDIANDGALDSIGWTDATADDVWLALDLNDNGLIENGGELFGNATEQSEIPLPNGFNALADYDKAKYGGNGDGWISAADPIYVYLVLWRDQNHNGVSESTELFSLQSLNVVAISLGYQSWRHADPNGNEFRYVSEVIVNIGGTPVSRAAVDVYLVANGGTPALAP